MAAIAPMLVGANLAPAGARGKQPMVAVNKS
jgi:hypothetical protein